LGRLGRTNVKTLSRMRQTNDEPRSANGIIIVEIESFESVTEEESRK